MNVINQVEGQCPPQSFLQKKSCCLQAKEGQVHQRCGNHPNASRGCMKNTRQQRDQSDQMDASRKLWETHNHYFTTLHTQYAVSICKTMSWTANFWCCDHLSKCYTSYGKTHFGVLDMFPCTKHHWSTTKTFQSFQMLSLWPEVNSTFLHDIIKHYTTLQLESTVITNTWQGNNMISYVSKNSVCAYLNLK